MDIADAGPIQILLFFLLALGFLATFNVRVYSIDRFALYRHNYIPFFEIYSDINITMNLDAGTNIPMGLFGSRNFFQR